MVRAMSRGLIGKKLGMTVVFTSDGKYVPVTVLKVGPCVVTQIKTDETDGYNALQLGFGEKKKSRMKKPVEGHLKKSGLESRERRTKKDKPRIGSQRREVPQFNSTVQ